MDIGREMTMAQPAVLPHASRRMAVSVSLLTGKLSYFACCLAGVAAVSGCANAPERALSTNVPKYVTLTTGRSPLDPDGALPTGLADRYTL
jgi:hypothetical protein